MLTSYFKQNKQAVFYLLRFGVYFCLLYFGTLAVIGLSTPENQYSPFVARYLNFINPLRASVLFGAKFLLSGFGIESILTDQFTLALKDGNAVRMVYSCIGYGVMSFWAAFVMANAGPVQTKSFWLFGGLLLLWIINVVRIGLLLVANQKHWPIPFGWDHHTWFNVIAYAGIFLMIYLYDKSVKSTKRSSEVSAP